MTYEQITFERRGRVGLVTLDRPQKLNAWTPRMMAEYRDAIERANADPSIGAIVMTGAGRAFCAGADLAKGGDTFNYEKRDASAEIIVDGVRRDGGGRVVLRIFRSLKPVIAAINGAAVGVGITQVLPFDLRIASEDARIGFFFVRMGLVPELGSSAFLPRLVGAGRALEWCFTGRMIGAQEARDAGLVTEVVAAGALLDRALALGEELSERPLDAIGLIRSLLRDNAHERDLRAVTRREGEALRQAYSSPEHREAVKAFLEKRAPNFAAARQSPR